jgi:hypothetical protein
MEDDFSLDNLVVEEEEVRTPAIMPVTVLVCETEYEQQKNIEEIIDGIRGKILQNYAFRKKRIEGTEKVFLISTFLEIQSNVFLPEKRLLDLILRKEIYEYLQEDYDLSIPHTESLYISILQILKQR